MESLCDLLFEISNEDRLRILQQIRDIPSSISGLARDLDLSSQEASRRARAALLKIEFDEYRYPDGFTEDALIYIERTNLGRRWDAVDLGVLKSP